MKGIQRALDAAEAADAAENSQENSAGAVEATDVSTRREHETESEMTHTNEDGRKEGQSGD